jgi:hypothetical protein
VLSLGGFLSKILVLSINNSKVLTTESNLESVVDVEGSSVITP